MRYSLKTMFVVITGLSLAICLATWIFSPAVYKATLLNGTSLRTDAPSGIVAEVCGDVYDEMRLRHFMDTKGRVTFADGTSRDSTSNEIVSVTDGIATGIKYFDDPKGNKITLKWITEPKIGTLISWEYQESDPQDVSVAIQKALAKRGVTLD